MMWQASWDIPLRGERAGADDPALTLVDEHALLQQARAGDQESLAQLLKAQLPRAYPAALAILRSPQDAEDVLQEAAMTALQQLSNLRQDGAFSSWFLRIVVNRCRDMLRRRRVRAAEPIEDNLTPSAEQAWGVEASLDLTHALERLSPDHRTVVVLHYGLGYTTDQVASIVGKAPGTVRRLLSESYRSLRVLLGDRYLSEE